MQKDATTILLLPCKYIYKLCTGINFGTRKTIANVAHDLHTSAWISYIIPFGILLRLHNLPHIVVGGYTRKPFQKLNACAMLIEIELQIGTHTIAWHARRGGANQRHQRGKEGAC